MLSLLLFIVVTLGGYILALLKGPFWGLVAYAYVYFNCPDPGINWWADYLPGLRWSLLSAGILLTSMIIHSDKLSTHKLTFSYSLIFILYIINELLADTIAVSPAEGKIYAYWMLGYCIMTFLIIKVLSKFEQLRLFLLTIILLAAYLGLQAHFEGEFDSGRLNNIGPADGNGSNGLGLLVSSILPFILPFIMRGRKVEKVICWLALPLIVNCFTLTVSRGAFLALIFGMVYAFFFVSDRKLKKYIVIMAVCLTPIFMFFIDESYTDRISSLWHHDTSSQAAVNDLSSGRMDIWRYSLKMVNDYPFGTGPGGFREIARFYMPEQILTFETGAAYGVRAAHNTFLLVLVELGYVGFFCFIVLCLSIMHSLYASSKRLKQVGKGGDFFDLVVIALNMSLASTLFGGLFGSHFYFEFFWWQVALSIVVKSFVGKMEQGELDNAGGIPLTPKNRRLQSGSVHKKTPHSSGIIAITK